MAATGVDHDGGKWLDRDALVIELQKPLTLQNKVDFRRLIVIVCARIRLNLNQMNAGRGLFGVGKGTPRNAAGALNWRQSI